MFEKNIEFQKLLKNRNLEFCDFKHICENKKLEEEIKRLNP